MKKYFIYIVALITVAITACNPMKDTLTELNIDQTYKKAITLTVTTTYTSTDAANTGIAATLNSSYPQLADKSTATVTYKVNSIKPADSLYANTLFTVTDAEYTAAAAATGTSYKSYSDAQVLLFLEYKYPTTTTAVNKLVLLTYNFYQSGVTPSAGVAVTEAFLLMSTGWKKINLVSAAQYASLGRGTNNMFTSADQANLTSYFNTFLKADAAVMATAKTGDVRYYTYKYYQSSTISYQRVHRLMYDGTNWTATGTLSFIKLNGKWIPDPNIYYQLVAADYTSISANTDIGTALNRANLASYKNFNLNSGTTQWTTAQIEAAMIYILNTKYPSAAVNADVQYVITYYAYYNYVYSYPTMSFVKTASGFVRVTN